MISMAEQSRIVMDCQSKPMASYKSYLGRTSRKRKLIILRYPLFTKTMFGSDFKILVNRKRLVHNTEPQKFLSVRYVCSIKNMYYFFKPTLHKGYNCNKFPCTWHVVISVCTLNFWILQTVTLLLQKTK